jgi:hypothetical protein
MGTIAANWLPVSGDAQDQAMQVPDVDRLISEREYEPSGPVYKFKASASKGHHQAMLDKALADARAGKFDILVA